MPSDLKYGPISALADVNPPTDRIGLLPNSLVSFIPMADVSNEGEWVNRQERQLQEVETGYTAFRENDILFAKITPCTENGKGAHAVGLTNGIGFGSTEFHVLRPKHPDSGRFLSHWSQSEQLRVRAASVMTGSAGQQRVPAWFFDEFEIPLLPLPEQRRIAEILDAGDEAIRQTERVIAKLKAVKAGLLHDLLTCGLDEHGHLRDPQAHPEQFKDSPLGRIPREWRLQQLIEVASYQNGRPFPSTEYRDRGIPLLRPGNLPNDDFIRWDKAHTTCLPDKWAILAADYIVRGDELVMNLTAQSLEDQFLGRVCMTPPDTYCLLNQRIARFRAKRCTLPFLFWSLKGPHFRKQIDRVPQGTKVQHIYDKDLNEIILPIPIRESEQTAISEKLFAHSARIRAEEVTLAKLRQVKRGLMDDLLTGKVRGKL